MTCAGAVAHHYFSASRFMSYWTRSSKETQGTAGLRDVRERTKLVSATVAVWGKLVPGS